MTRSATSAIPSRASWHLAGPPHLLGTRLRVWIGAKTGGLVAHDIRKSSLWLGFEDSDTAASNFAPSLTERLLGSRHYPALPFVDQFREFIRHDIKNSPLNRTC